MPAPLAIALVLVFVVLMGIVGRVETQDLEEHAAWMAQTRDSGAVVLW